MVNERLASLVPDQSTEGKPAACPAALIKIKDLGAAPRFGIAQAGEEDQNYLLTMAAGGCGEVDAFGGA